MAVLIFRRWWLLFGVVLVSVVALNSVVDAKAAPVRGAVCVRVGAKVLDEVSDRGLVCVQTKARGLRWRFEPSSATANVAALTCATGGTCIVGNMGPGGGIVFYVASTNFTSTGSDCGKACKYLEAAPADQSSDIAWCSYKTGYVTTATAIGTGMANTTTAETRCTTGAIRIAADYTNNSKTDWHLPSKDELNRLFNNRVTVGIIIGDEWDSPEYWSSSQIGFAAWFQWFFNGFQGPNGKKATYSVRPVRAFG